MPELTRQAVAAWDAEDPLGSFRDRFTFACDDLLYLDGNSLGRLPRATPELLTEVVTAEWGGGLVRSWTGWIDWNKRIGDTIGTHLLGVAEGQVVLSDSTSVNLYKLAAAALADAPNRGTIVLDSTDFPTNRYILQGLAAERGLVIRAVDDPARLADALDDDVALLALSLVNFRSAELVDMAWVNALARRTGTRVLWDLSHAVGVVPIQLAADGAELAVGCTYKYLNGGPGAPGLLYVSRELQRRLRQPIWGWFGQRDQFAMDAAYEPVENIDRFLVGTPPILSLAAVAPGVDLCVEAGLQRIRDKSVRLCELVIELADRWLGSYGLSPVSPRASRHRGAHVGLRGPDTWRLCRAWAQAGVVCDFRAPDVLRIAPVPLYTRYTEVWDALVRLRTILERGQHKHLQAARSRVT